jgi:hypothetical protein
MENRLESVPHNTRRELIQWWEMRRFHFNGVVLAIGFASLILVMCVGSAAVKPGVDFVEPLAILSSTALYLAIANVCYTLGWVVDTTFYNGRPCVPLYRSGLIFAGILTALPGVWAVAAWLITVHSGQKLD